MADIADIRSLLERRITPCLLLTSCPSAEKIAVDHGFNHGGMLEVFRPFLVLPTDVHLQVGRDPADTRLATVSGFSARLHTDATILETRPEVRPAVVGAEMRNCAQEELDQSARITSVLEKIASGDITVGVDEDGETVTTGKNNTELRHPILSTSEVTALSNATFPSWFARFIADYCSMLRFSYLDTIDHPVCLLYAVQTSPTIADELNELRAADATGPQRMMSTYPHVDAALTKIVLLFHDVATATADYSEDHRRQIVEKFCPQGHCYVIKFDSRQRTDGTPQVDVNPFSPTMDYLGYRVDQLQQLLLNEAGGSPVSQRSSRLPKPLYDEIQRTLQHVLRNNVIMCMRAKLRDLRDYIEQNRQTTFDKIANFFGKKEQRPQREAFAPMPNGDGRYFYYALEMQMRRAGDLSFMLHDYEAAAYHYKQYRDELDAKLKDRPFNRKLQPGAIEAIAMANVMIGRLPLPGVPKQESKLEVAMTSYSTAEVHSHSFRASLLLVAQCRVRSVPANDRALQVLTRLMFTQMPPLYRAMMGDQAALCWLLFNPPFPGALGTGEGYLEPNARRPADGYAALTFVRKYAQMALCAALDYRSSGVSPPQDEHALRCASGAYAILKQRRLPTHAALATLLLSTLINTYRHLGLIKEATMAARALCCSGVGTALDLQQYFALAKQYQSTLTEWAPTGSAVDAASVEVPPPSAFLMFPVVSPSTARIDVDTFAMDAVTVNEETVLGASSDTASSMTIGLSRIAQAWNNHLDAARKYFAATKVPLGRSMAHHKVSLLTGMSQSRKLIAAQQGDADAALVRVRHVTVSRDGSGTAFSIMVDNLIKDASVKVSQPRLLVAALPPGAPLNKRHAVTELDRTTHRCAFDDVMVPPSGSAVLCFDINTSVEGVFVIVGTTWSVDGVVCDSFFAAVAVAEPSHPDFATLCAQEATRLVKSGLPLDHPSHCVITVGPAEATLSVDFEPPLPLSILDGELHHTELVLHVGPHADASNVRVVFNKCCFNLLHPAHSVALDGDGTEHRVFTSKDRQEASRFTRIVNGDRSSCLVFEGTLAAGEEVRVPFIFRGEGGYTKRLATAATAVVFNTVMAMALYTTAPRNASPTTGPKPVSMYAANGYISKFLRRIRVHRSLSLTSSVIPPTSPCMPTILQLAVDNLHIASSSSNTKAPPLPKRAPPTTVDSFFEQDAPSAPPSAPPPPTEEQPVSTMKVVRLAAVSVGYQVVALGNGGINGAAAHLTSGRRATLALGSTVASIPPTDAVTSPAQLLRENVCVPLRVALSSSKEDDMTSAVATADQALGGQGACDSAWQLHFLRFGAVYGAEAVDCAVPLLDEMSFYADGGDDENKAAALEAQRVAALEKQRALTEALRQAILSPVTIVAMWRFASPMGGYKFGLTYHSTDASALKKCAMLQRQRFKLPSALTLEASSQVQPRKTDQNTVALTADGLGVVEGCFASEPVYGAACASGSFTVWVRNMSVYNIAARLSVEPVFGTVFAPHPAFTFVGKTSWEVKLPPRGQVSVSVTAVFFAPGVYNVSCVQFRVRGVTDEQILADGSKSSVTVQPTILVTGNDTPWIMTVVARAPKPGTDPVPFASPIRDENAPIGRRSITLPMETVNARIGAAVALRNLGSPNVAASSLDYVRSPLQDASDVVKALKLLSPSSTTDNGGQGNNILQELSPPLVDDASVLDASPPTAHPTGEGHPHGASNLQQSDDSSPASPVGRELYFDPTAMSPEMDTNRGAGQTQQESAPTNAYTVDDELNNTFGLLEPSHTMIAAASAVFRSSGSPASPPLAVGTPSQPEPTLAARDGDQPEQPLVTVAPADEMSRLLASAHDKDNDDETTSSSTSSVSTPRRHSDDKPTTDDANMEEGQTSDRQAASAGEAEHSAPDGAASTPAVTDPRPTEEPKDADELV